MKKYNLSNGSRLVSSSESLPEISWFTIYNTLNKLNHTDKKHEDDNQGWITVTKKIDKLIVNFKIKKKVLRN
jgi:hypothetical protein